MFAKLHRELAAGTLDFIHVAELCRKLKIESETTRWEALDKLQKKYLAKLDTLRIWDVQSARLFALERPEEFEPKQTQFQNDGTQIMLVGVVDMNLAQKELLRHFGNFVTSLVFAPEDWNNRFDDLGCLIPHVWQEATIELDEKQVHIVESASEQAEAVLQCLTELKGQFAPPEIIVGVPDKQVIPFIERQFEQVKLKTRIVAGKSIRQTPVYRFLEVLLPFLESPTFAHFATLVRHPDVETFLQEKLPQPVNLIEELDNFHSDYLPVGSEMLERSETLKTAWQHLQMLTEPQSLDCGTNCLRQIFPKHHRDEAYHKILDTLSQIKEIPKELLPQPLSLADTVRLVLTQVGRENIPMPHEPKAVELVGWLDLAMDDAEVVIVTGMNDGVVPAFQTSDMFLPDTMRQQLSKERRLSIEDNSRRYARDAYALSCLLATRQYDPLRIQLIGSRRSVEGDPMLPSRLFFAADDETVTKRVKHFFDEHRKSMPEVKVPRIGHGAEITFPLPAIPENAGKQIKKMSVTEFKEYKACPYRYYLKYQYGLKTLNDADDELDAKNFGNGIHKVLDWFGKEEKLKKSTSAERIRDFLVSNFRELIRKQYGDQPRAVIPIQTERAIKRLEAFADWQANWAGTHEILETELKFIEDRFTLDVDGKVMILRGTIDRIDWDKKTKELVILDYKTGNKDDPKQHIQKGEWVDFQLPLYYHLLGQHAEYAERLRRGYQLGYIVLPSNSAKTGERLAEWEQPVSTAIEDARKIVRCIWNNEFDKTDPPPKYSEALAAICNDF